MKGFFSPEYAVDIGDHVFPTRKFALVAAELGRRGLFGPGELVEPPLPDRATLLLAHTAEWVDRVLDCRLTLEDETLMELPGSPALARAHARAVSGTLLAAREALDVGVGLHVGGGSHHAFADHGEGFCVFNDLACALKALLREGRIRRALIVDLDVHQGNGSAAIFAADPAVATFSMHAEGIYPAVKPPSTLDIGLAAGTGDDEYLRLLAEHLPRLLDQVRPELVLYQAGVDCYERDNLGVLKLTAAGIEARDRLVSEECRRRRVPVAVTLGGGYAQRLEETVELHCRTLELAAAKAR